MVIMNPVADHGETLNKIGEIEDFLKTRIIADFHQTSYPKEAVQVARHLQDYDMVIVAGGDGTVHEVVNGIKESLNTRTILGVLPTGSGNDLSGAIGISNDLHEAMSQMIKGKKKEIDLGLVNNIYFVNSLGIGFDARVAHMANSLKDLSTKTGISLYLSALLNILFHDFYCYSVRLKIDDGEWMEKEVLLIAANNGPTYGGGFKITPDARLDDGLLDICVVDKIPRWQVLPRLPFVIFGKHAWMKPAHMYRARRLVIECDMGLPAALDGELILADRYEISIKPKALSIVDPI